MIDCLKKNKSYSKHDLVKLVKDISGSLIAYDRYVYSKGNKCDGRKLPLNEGKKLYEYLKDYLVRVRKGIG